MNSIYRTSQNEYYATLQDAMTAEKCKYINDQIDVESGKFLGFAPRQFNINIARSEYTSDPEKKMYAVEFLGEEEEYINATTWLSGDAAQKVFIDCDADEIDISNYEEDWIEQV